MIPFSADYAFPPNDSLFPISNSPAMTLPPHYPSPQQQAIQNPPLPSHVHPLPMLRNLLHHAEPLSVDPSGAMLTMHIHDDHVSYPVLAHHPSTSEPSLQMHRLEMGGPNIEARQGTAATDDRFQPIPTNLAISTNVDPTPMKHPRTHNRVTIHPYTRVSFRKKTHPAAEYTPDMVLVQARCVADGADPAAVNLLRAIFAGDISTKALTRRMTRDEAREYNHGTSGQMYRVFLRIDEGNRFHCRLCAVGADEGGWKQAKDVLRHLRRDHFGLGSPCNRCGKMFYTTGELTSHRCVRSRGI